jgi:hypothetical protein
VEKAAEKLIFSTINLPKSVCAHPKRVELNVKGRCKGKGKMRWVGQEIIIKIQSEIVVIEGYLQF